MDPREGLHSRPDDEGKAAPEAPRGGGPGRTLALVVILSAFWLLLSGRLTVPFLIMMAVVVAAVVMMNPERPFGGGPRSAGRRREGVEPSRGEGLRGRIRAAGYLLRYVAWLVWAVIRANVDVAIRILHPRLPIRPRLMVFETTIDHPVGRVLVANSITLTPGTVTIDLKGNRYLVHALAPEVAGELAKGHLQNAVAPVFGEGPDPAPRVRWATSYREVEGEFERGDPVP